MAASTYDAALARLLVHEGGYTNHPADPGGATNFGITIADYRRYVKPGATANDVKAMKLDEAKAIYRARYWDSQRCDDLPAGVDDSIFDYGVNSGIGRSGKVLRRVLGLPDSTSKIDASVLAALAKRDTKAVIKAINAERLRFLQSLRTWSVFGKGWGSRIAEVNSFSLQLAARGEGSQVLLPQPKPEVQAAGKGMVAPTPPLKQAGAGGTIIAAGAAAAKEAHNAGHPILIVACISGVACIVAVGIVIWLRSHHERQQLAATPGVVPVPTIR